MLYSPGAFERIAVADVPPNARLLDRFPESVDGDSSVKRSVRILARIGLVLLLVVLALGGVYLALPKGPRDPMPYTDRTRQPRDLFVGKDYAAVTGTPWATDAALDILARGGTACDAAVAGLLAVNVTHGEAASFAGVAPTMFYNAETGEVRSYIGVGNAPAAATIDAFQQRGFETVPELDIWSQLVPASPDVIVALLRDCGSMSFAEVAAPAIKIAREGFPAHQIMVRNFDLSPIERLGLSFLLPENARVYFHGEWWRPMNLHDRMQFPDLANTFESLARAEQQAVADGKSRDEALQAVRDYVYRGPIAEAIVKMHQDQGGLIAAADLADYRGGWEAPVVGRYGAYTLYGNGTWSQGVMEPMILQMLDGIDLKAMGHNSPQYIHTVTQAIDLAMADRDTFVADPAFVKVPLDVLLSPGYANKRRALMSERAFPALPAPGDIPGFGGARTQAPEGSQRAGVSPLQALALRSDLAIGQDTSQVVVRDRQGNAVVITPSDFPKTPMVPGTGINLGNRMNQFRLDPAHVNALQPGKRPRITPHAMVVFRDGEFWMALSTPGGDMQAQALVQVLLNMIVFDMDVQQAISAPRFSSISAPSSFAPHESTPAGLRLEADLYAQTAESLRALGYTTIESPRWDKDFGAVGAILRGDDGAIFAGADPREETTAGGK